MIIIAGYTLTDAEQRDQAVAVHAEMVARPRLRRLHRPRHQRAPVDLERINIFEHSRDQAALDAWRGIANPPTVVRRETYVKLYRTDKAESPF